MKFKKCISYLMAASVFASCFAGMTVLAASTEIISNGTVIYANDFEAETAEDGKAPATFKLYDHGNTKTYLPCTAAMTIVAKDATSSDPSRLGNKYMLVGVSERDGDVKTGDTRFGDEFTAPVSSGIVNIDFDAAVYDDAIVTGEFANLGFAGASANYWFFGANAATGYIGVGANGSTAYVSKKLFTAGEWNHYSITVDLDKKTSTLTLNGTSYTQTLDCKGDTLKGFMTYTPMATNFAIDNFMITTGSQIQRTVYADYSFENGTDALTYVGPTGSGVNRQSAKIVNTADVTLGDGNNIYNGAYTLGSKVYDIGSGTYNRYNTVLNNGAKGIYKIEFDALTANGGLGVGFGSNANGGGIGGRYPFAFQRATGKFVAETAGTISNKWFDSATDSTEVCFTAEGTDTSITYVKNKWTHVILEINAETGDVTATVDGVKSNPVNVPYIVSAPITSIGFAYCLSQISYEGAKDHNAYIDNLRITYEDNLDIKAVASAKGKIIVEFKNAIGTVSASDVTVSGGTVTAVNVSGNKLLADVTGLNADGEYDIVLSDNVKFADGTALGLKSYRFTYKASEFSATPVMLTLDGKTARAVVNAQPSLENKTIYSYIAAYDEAGNLVDAVEKTIAVSNLDYVKKAVPVTYTFSDDAEIKTVKAFAWDADMVPFDNASDFIVQ